MAAAFNLQRDAGLMLPNLSQFVTSLHRISSEMMSIGIGRVVFPAEEIADFCTAPTAPRAAKYIAAMGLCRRQMGPGDPGPVPASSCNTSYSSSCSAGTWWLGLCDFVDECSYNKIFLTCGRLPWLCNIYMGRDAVGSFCVFQFMV